MGEGLWVFTGALLAFQKLLPTVLPSFPRQYPSKEPLGFSFQEGLRARSLPPSLGAVPKGNGFGTRRVGTVVDDPPLLREGRYTAKCRVTSHNAVSGQPFFGRRRILDW